MVVIKWLLNGSSPCGAFRQGGAEGTGFSPQLLQIPKLRATGASVGSGLQSANPAPGGGKGVPSYLPYAIQRVGGTFY